MQILIAEHAGFCEGVERAYRIALEQTISGKPVYMLGNLVHNSQVVEKLKNAGIKTVKSLSEIPTGTKGSLLISAHGVSPEVYNEAKTLGLSIIDTTCPWVKKAQHLAKELADKGMTVIIIGDEGHPEVKGLLGWAGINSLVVQTPEDLAGIESLNFFQSGIGVVAQTTQSEANFDAIVKALRGKFNELVVHKTICGATSKRQNTAVELAQKVELMLVIGDKMSANTKRLTELCAQTGTETHQIQTADELDKSWFKEKSKIGITAGASTPEWVIKEVTTLLRAP